MEQIVGLANYRDNSYFVVGINEDNNELTSVSGSDVEGFIEGLESSLTAMMVSPKLKYEYYTINQRGKTIFVLELDYVKQELHHLGETNLSYPFRVNSQTQFLNSEQVREFNQSGKIPFSDKFEFASYPHKDESITTYTPIRKENNVAKFSLPISQKIRESEMVETKFGGGQEEVLENFLYRIDNHERLHSIRDGTICISQNNCNWYNKGSGKEVISAIENPEKLPDPDFKVDRYKRYSGAYVNQYTLYSHITLTLILELDFNDNGLNNAYISLLFSNQPATDEFLTSLKITTQMMFRGWESKDIDAETKNFGLVTNEIKIEEGSKGSCLIFVKDKKAFTEHDIFVTSPFKWFYSDKEKINGVDLESIIVYPDNNFGYDLTLYKTDCRLTTETKRE